VGGRLSADLAREPGLVVRAVARRPVPWLAPAVEQVVTDLICDPVAVENACAGVDAVVHLAGANEVAAAEDPDRALSDTVIATAHVAEAARRAGVQRFVYVSTVHVYAASMANGTVLTEDLVPSPRHVYAIARLASEHLAAAAATPASSMDVVVFRLTNSVGAPLDPGVDRWSLVANDLCRQAATTGSLRLRTHGLQWRDFVAMADVCRILAAAMPGDRAHPCIPPGTYNLGSGEPMTVRQLAGLVQDACEGATGHRPPLVAPAPPAEALPAYSVSVGRLARLGLGARTTVRSAVEETLAFCLKHRGEL